MSENKNKQKGSSSALIATVIVAAAAVAAIVVLIIVMNSGSKLPGGSGEERYSATSEQIDECLTSAHDLVASNYIVIKLYITEGLPHLDEPYGNKPEDGIYTVDSDKYKTPDDMQNLLRSIYTEQAANDIWARGAYKTRYMKNGLAVNSDTAGAEQVLGISEDFNPDTNYSVDWSSTPLEVIPVAEDKCRIVIYINGASPNDSDVSEGNTITTEMIKESGEWRLTELIS